MAAWLDNVKFNPTAGGTTDWTVSTAVQNYQLPSAGGAVNGRPYKYFAVSTDGSGQWEIGEGAYNTTGPVLPRTTVLYNSSGTGTATGQTGAGTKINFTNPPQISVVGLKEDLISVEEANSFTSAQRQQARTNISVGLKGGLFGLTLSTAGSSATFGIAAGEAADSTGVDLMVLASTYTKTTSAWAVGTAAGALDTGAIANATWYHIYEIKRPDTGVVDIAISVSASAPTVGGTIPAAYTLFRRIGSMKTNGSAQWVKFVQVADEFIWDSPPVDVNNDTTLSTTRKSYALSVPLGVIVTVKCRLLFSNSAAGAQVLALSALTTATPSLVGNLTVITSASTLFNIGQLALETNTSQNIVLIGNTAANNSVYIATDGWIDTRGRYG